MQLILEDKNSGEMAKWFFANITGDTEAIPDGIKFKVENLNSSPCVSQNAIPEIKRVIYNNPATIVFWKDGTKTVVTCNDSQHGELKTVDGKKTVRWRPYPSSTYSEETGLAMAIVKRMAGNKGNYNNIFRK